MLGGLQTLMNVLIGLASGALLLGGVYLIVKGGHFAKAFGLLLSAVLVVGAYAVILARDSIGPWVVSLFQ